MKVSIMASLTPWSLLLSFLLLCGTSGGSDTYFRPKPAPPGVWIEASIGEPWPKPASIQQDSQEVATLDPNTFTFLLDGGAAACPTLTNSLQRFYARLFPQSLTRKLNALTRNVEDLEQVQEARDVAMDWLNVQLVGDCETWPLSNMDESYSLNVDAISPFQSSLQSGTVWGILRGLETFTQIVYFRDNQFKVNTTLIEDSPRFPFRGFMLDTSRHFITTSVIMETLDLMEMSKMNVFHWHLTDDTSFPYQSTTFPDLSGSGAYDQSLVYTQADVANVLEAARLRGIRVIPEFDTPGHTKSWGLGFPELLTVCYEEDGQTSTGIPGPMDPTQENVYSFLDSFFQEVSGVFYDEYLHLGGDEVVFDCWASNPATNQTMEDWGIAGDYAALQSYFMSRVLDIYSSVGKKSIVWQEVFENGDPIESDTIVEAWKYDGWESLLTEITSSKHQAILSAPWYVSEITYGSDWVPFYLVEPLNFTSTDPTDKDYVLGGEACMWGNYVDSTNLISRSWPRVSAVAERLWSPVDQTDEWEAAARIEEHQCRMVARGHQAEPIVGPSYCGVEWTNPNY